KINKISDGVFEWSKGANKAIFDTKSNVIKMNTTGAFFLVHGLFHLKTDQKAQLYSQQDESMILILLSYAIRLILCNKNLYKLYH
ncbi:hypothetical protein, partial [Mycoplasmopsis bovis]|uniref:hypothetical protein n=1 Tax=Mycoplasmopsis bovis TaxID=28903 RepID=UPI003D2C58E5